VAFSGTSRCEPLQVQRSDMAGASAHRLQDAAKRPDMLRTARQTPRPCSKTPRAGIAVGPLTRSLCTHICRGVRPVPDSTLCRSPDSLPRWPRCWCRPCDRARRAGRSASAWPRRTTLRSCPTAPTSSTASSCWLRHTWCVLCCVALEQRRVRCSGGPLRPLRQRTLLR